MDPYEWVEDVDLAANVDATSRLLQENRSLKEQLEEANKRIAMLEDELGALEEEVAMYEDDESRHV